MSNPLNPCTHHKKIIKNLRRKKEKNLGIKEKIISKPKKNVILHPKNAFFQDLFHFKNIKFFIH